MSRLILTYGTLRDDLGYMPKGPYSGMDRGLATVPGDMYTWGEYPMAVWRGSGRITGMLQSYEHLVGMEWAKQLYYLDRFENIQSGLFCRTITDAVMEDGTTHRAWVYYLADERQLSVAKLVPSGDWADHISWRLS